MRPIVVFHQDMAKVLAMAMAVGWGFSRHVVVAVAVAAAAWLGTFYIGMRGADEY